MPAPRKKCGVYTMYLGLNGLRIMHKMEEEQVPVWVVDDRASSQLGTAATVAATKDFVMAGECETGESAIELLRESGAGIVLMDIHMPGMGGIEATRRIRAAHPEIDGAADVDLRPGGPPRGGRRLRRRGLPAQRTPESRGADSVMASGPLKPRGGRRIGALLGGCRRSFLSRRSGLLLCWVTTW